MTRHSPGMEFAPAIDPRLRASVGRIVDLRLVGRRLAASLRRRARRFRTTTPCYESVRKLVIAERERPRDGSSPRSPPCSRSRRGRVPVLPEHVPHDATAGGSRQSRAGDGCSRAPAALTVRAAATGKAARKGEGRLSAALDPGSQRWIWQRRFLPEPRLDHSRQGRRRGTRVPFARLWRFPSGSRGHASTRWYLHCRYCWNLSRPDHLLSAVRPNVYRDRWTTASPDRRRTAQASTHDHAVLAHAHRVGLDRDVRRQRQRAARLRCRSARRDAGRPTTRSPQSNSPSQSGPSSWEQRSSSANSSPSQL